MSEFLELHHSFTFESAHFLPRVPADHKCRRMHGHSFRADVTVRGPVDAELGWVIDYAAIKAAVEPVRLALDHYLLNEIVGLENPTSEMLAIWIWQRLKPALPNIVTIRVYETCNNSCTYRGPVESP
ncbi:MAG: 6-carboxytetrahydropterin synthase QueD [Planctomycetota bacterium]